MANEPLIVLSAGAALAYGVFLSPRPPSAGRTVIKTLAVAPLAVLVFLENGHPLVAAGLALSALGDAFLAGDPKKWLPFGLGAFLLAHLLYVAVFLYAGGDIESAFEPLRAIGILATLGAAGAMLAWLWPALGKMKLAVVAYVAAIAAMVAASLLLPPSYWPVMLGALAFFASDGVLSVDLFKGLKLAGSARITAWAIWGLYYLGQVGITAGFIQ
ncbi:MAG: YhhN family protein [Caulobacter sp.]|nr:YhhN family protein [Caulobacter sp.]